MACYGFPPPGTDPGTLAALWFNIPRARMQQSMVAAQAIALAGSKDDIDEGWADAWALLPEEASDVLFEANAARADARARDARP